MKILRLLAPIVNGKDSRGNDAARLCRFRIGFAAPCASAILRSCEHCIPRLEGAGPGWIRGFRLQRRCPHPRIAADDYPKHGQGHALQLVAPNLIDSEADSARQ